MLAAVSILLVSAAQARAQELPDFVIGAVAEVVAHKESPFNSETRIKQGSGVFIDHGGCLYTNSHVVLNFDTGEPEPYFAVNITTNRARKPQYAFEAEVLYVDQGLDMAYLCPVKDNGVFTEYFDRVAEPMFEQRKFGESVFIMGFPAAGEGTITISPGHIIGFIENPNVEEWLGTPELDTDALKVYKTDALAGPGVSGGVMVNSNLDLVGVPFAGTILPGAFIFSLSENVYQEFDRRMREDLYRNGFVPLDCVYDLDSGYYLQSGVKFYDQSCSMPFDKDMEYEVNQTYAAFCGQEIKSARRVNVIRRSKQLGDLSKWSESVEAKCGKAETKPEEPIKPEKRPSLQAGTFAYGFSRLSDLSLEATQVVEFTSAIGGRPKGLSETNWQILTRAYVYGGYPVNAINRAMELGGVTVHPSIPYEAWKGSEDYKKGMSSI